jgi:O-acetyl-ADP-ribose deacetylase (regulator of RNase III)
MYQYVEGNLFETPAQTLVNTVNTVGAMGKGIAKEFKRLFPDMFVEYQKHCESKKLDIGSLWLYPTRNKWVLSFPTKKHWRQPSRIEYIEAGLKTFAAHYNEMRITSAAFPRIGCGNGELDWEEVRPLMDRYLKKLPIDIYVYEKSIPIAPEHQNLRQMREWLQTEPSSYPFAEFRRDLEKLFGSSAEFRTVDGSIYAVEVSESATIITLNGDDSTILWEGDEFSFGWLQLWQFIRDRGICTENDLIQMGFRQTKAIVSSLLQLQYLQRLVIRSTDHSSVAVQLRPRPLPKPDLFGSNDQRPQPPQVI